MNVFSHIFVAAVFLLAGIVFLAFGIFGTGIGLLANPVMIMLAGLALAEKPEETRSFSAAFAAGFGMDAYVFSVFGMGTAICLILVAAIKFLQHRYVRTPAFRP